MSRSVARVALVVLMAAALPAVARAQLPRKPALPKVRLPGELHGWHGLRKVPLGLVILPR
ncbi:MAG TPA: hypothetical protein VGR60_08915 [Gemmatimonadales bacterium]|nr:hypothetical protein [Gemmatimonadales bacterium]